MDVVIGHGVFFNVFKGEVVAVRRYHLYGERARQRGYTTGFPLVDVGAMVGEDGMWGLAHVGADAELVAHRAGGDEEGGGMAGQ